MVRFLLIGLVAALCAVGAARGVSAFGDHAKAPPVAAVAEAAPPAPAPPLSYGEASIAKAPDGQFWADALVDGQQVHFLVDTGASMVALTPDDARRLGFDPSTLSYTGTVTTANGTTRAAQVKLGRVAVGRAEVTDVPAIVIQQGLDTSLLGMSYLSRLSEWKATSQALDLKS